VDADESIHLSVRQAFEELAPGWTLDAYSGADEALKRIPLSPPSVVLLDTLVSDSFGIECARRLKLVLPALPIVMHTAKADGHAVLLAFMAGASGCLRKPLAPLETVDAIHKILAGRPALCPEAQEALTQCFRNLGARSQFCGLTEREQEILAQLFRNPSDKDLAESFQISVRTVQAHLASIYSKLQIHSRDEAIQTFLGLGSKTPHPEIKRSHLAIGNQ